MLPKSRRVPTDNPFVLMLCAFGVTCVMSGYIHVSYYSCQLLINVVMVNVLMLNVVMVNVVNVGLV